MFSFAAALLDVAGFTSDLSCYPFYQHGLTLIPTWISNHMPSNVWGEITYPFLNFNDAILSTSLALLSPGNKVTLLYVMTFQAIN